MPGSPARSADLSGVALDDRVLEEKELRLRDILARPIAAEMFDAEKVG